MRVPLSWLREFVSVPEEPEGLMDRLAMLGFGHEPVQWVGEEAVLDLEVASNRPDLLSILGVAREIGAAWEREVTPPRVTPRRSSSRAAWATGVTLEDAEGCPRYTAHVIAGVRVSASPDWMVRRLEAAGIRGINNVVDVTNYVMLEHGQPLHAFDLDRLAGPRIVVRRAHLGERLVTLDGVERALDPEVLVIADAERAVALAGVMGGADTEIGSRTTRVLLEAAGFHGPLVRRTARRLGLRTESSARFERSLDPRSVLDVARRAAALIAQVANGRVLAGAMDVYPHPAPLPVIMLRLARITRVLGMEVPEDAVVAILRRLGCKLTARRRERLTVTVPPGRMDLEREEDLIEEVARLYGYDRIPEAMPVEVVQAGRVATALEAEAFVRDLLIRAGLDEAVTLSLVAPEVLDRLGIAPDDPPRRLVALRNPLLADHTHLRSSLLPGLLEAMRANLSRNVEDVHLFEIGRIFRAAGAPGDQVAERRSLGIAMRGRLARGWNLPAEASEVTFFHLKGLLEELCAELQVEPRVESVARPWLHPGRGACLLLDGEKVGVFGELHPTAAERFELRGSVYVAVVNLEMLLSRATLTRRFEPLPRYPSVDRDLAVFVPQEVSQAEVLRVIRESGAPLLERADLFDVYTGPQAPPGQRSLAYALQFRAPDRTLTAEEADAALARIHQALRTVLGAVPRT